MKTKIVLSVLLVLSVAVFYFSKPNAKENSVTNIVSTASIGDTIFRIGFTNMGVQTDFSFLAPLKCNLWHKYLGHGTANGKPAPYGWTDIGAPSDTLYDISSYKSEVLGILNKNRDSNYLSYIMRPKIEMLAYSQRSDYQCEYVDTTNNLIDWWYSFRYSDYGNSYYSDSNVLVRHLKPLPDGGNDSPGYIVKQLRANREQVNNGYGLRNDTSYSWYIKPRMRIDSAFANNPANVNKKVCRIVVLNYDGDTVRKVDMTVLQFLNDTNFYNGSYKEDGFRFDDSPNKLLIDSGKVLNPFKRDSIVCKFDIQVYWYGECELWIDYVRVDNDWADRLFKHYYDDTWIPWEADQIASYGTTYNFYTDEMEYNNMPAIQYLNEKIHTYKPNLSLNALENAIYPPLLRDRSYPSLSSQHIINNISKCGMNEVMAEWYPLFGNVISIKWFNKRQTLPSTLGNYPYNPATGVLGVQVPPSVYEQNLDSIMNELYIPKLDSTKKIAVALNLPIHIITTNQLYYYYSDTNYSQKEPTNEELGLLNYLAVSYSAKAITQYAYWSFGFMSASTWYQRGLLGDGTEVTMGDTSKRRRLHNAYGQDKWTKTCQVNEKLQKWGTYLMKFNESLSHSYIYRNPTERGDLFNNSYFNQFVTQRPGPAGLQTDCNEDFTPQNIPSGWLFDCQYDTYLQIATFGSIETNSYYFMVINRRCSPYRNDYNDDSIGGKRKVRAYIKSDYFPASVSNNWAIYDCEKDSVVVVFPAHNPNYVNLDYFMPGEARLYKIVPNFTKKN